ncbi:MAG: hypothetical protein CL959_04600 [Euryarchaeota archaeon]|nr:hypothetical protein [Euryarchaeota archaeon]|tara:strand:- start:2173 stop:2430 length:258 start_codon:yes stop_codon:yes gene_type:complete
MKTEDNKPKRGRPRLYSDEERIERARESVKRSNRKHNHTTIAIRGEDIDKFRKLREAESKKLGFDLSNQQFFKLLFRNWEENNKG